jgi:nucleotide-binding universal stress UspA family protein
MSNAILLTTDFSDVAPVAYPHAIHMARRLHRPIDLMYVVDKTTHVHIENLPNADVWFESVTTLFQRRLETLADRLSREYDVAVRPVVVAGRTVPDILARAAQSSMLVLATHGYSGVRRFFLGSVAARLVHASPVPVLVIPPGEETAAPSKAVFATDLGRIALAATDDLLPLARATGLDIEVMHADAEPTLLAMIREEALTVPEAGGYTSRLRYANEHLEEWPCW